MSETQPAEKITTTTDDDNDHQRSLEGKKARLVETVLAQSNGESATELDDDEMMMGMKISAIKRGILKELTGLVEKGVFEVVEPNSVATNARAISTRCVHKPLGPDVKSRLVVRDSTI